VKFVYPHYLQDAQCGTISTQRHSTKSRVPFAMLEGIGADPPPLCEDSLGYTWIMTVKINKVRPSHKWQGHTLFISNPI